MFKVLDLFAGTQSVRKALDETDIKFQYIGIDIYSPEFVNTILDLSADDIVKKLKNILPKNWKPDFIWASPLCTTFSRATGIKNGTLSYEKTQNNKVKIRKNFSEIDHKAYNHLKDNKHWQQEQEQKGKLGFKLIENTKKIINYFNVPFVIENPAYALTRYILTEYKRTVTHYCMYGFDYKKATAIYSNQNFNLKKCNHKGSHKQVMSGNPTKTGIKSAPSSNKNRSVVPKQLIKDIIMYIWVQEGKIWIK